MKHYKLVKKKDDNWITFKRRFFFTWWPVVTRDDGSIFEYDTFDAALEDLCNEEGIEPEETVSFKIDFFND